MAKNKDTTEMLAELQQGTADALKEITAAMNDDTFDDSSLYGLSTVPASPVYNIAEHPEHLAQVVQGAPLQQGDGRGVSPGKLLKHYDPDAFAEINEAMKHVEKHLTPSSYLHDGYRVDMPGTVREKPNSLYSRYNEKGQRFAIRERADKIQAAIFGPENNRVTELCKRSGFFLNPLVFVSQTLYHHVVNGIPHDYESYANTHGLTDFDPDIDESENSPWIQALRTFLEGKTIRDLCKEARYRNVTVLSVVRCIMVDVASDRGIPPNFGEPVEVKA